MATSCFLRFQLSYCFPFPSSSCPSRSCTSYAQSESKFRGIRVPMATCSGQENSSQRFPSPPGSRPNALVPIEEGKVKAAVHNQNTEIATDQVARSLPTFQPSPIASFGLISLLLGLVLGYALNRKERAAAYAVIETMRRKQKVLEDKISFLQSSCGEQNTLMNLESGISKLSFDLFQVSKLLKSRLDGAQQHKVETLTKELKTAKEDLKKSQATVQCFTQELKAALKNNGIMQKKMGVVSKKLNAAAKDLNVEKMLVASLKDDVQLLENQLVKERELRKSLELNLKEATESLDALNQKVKFLFNQLKSFNSLILKLQGDKESLQKLLTDERRTSTQTKKNLEDAQNKIKKLGQEREVLESKANKLQEELDSTKGEMLSLKNQKISSSEVAGNDEE